MLGLRLPRPPRRAIRNLGKREGDIVRGDRLFEMLVVCIMRGCVLLERCSLRIDAYPSSGIYARFLRVATNSLHLRCIKFVISWLALEINFLALPQQSSAHLPLDFQEYRLLAV